MDLKKLLKKGWANLSDAEKAFVREHQSELSDAEKAELGDALKGDEGEDEDLDEESVKALINEHIQAALKGDEALAKRADSIAEKLAEKFLATVETQRKRALGGKPVARNAKADDVTREFIKALMVGDKARAKALTTNEDGTDPSPDDAAAGLLVPKELRTEVLRIAEAQYGLARRDMFYLPFSGPGNSRTVPALGTSVSVFWTDEKGKKRSTQPKFSIVTQTLKKLAAIVPMTEEILEDSAINLTQLIAQLFAEAVAKEEDLQFFAGTGSPWTGVLNNSQVNQVTEGDGAVPGDSNANLADDLLAMQDATPSGALNGAKYYLHRSWLSRIRKLKDSTGQYIYQAPANGQPGTIWNYPYETSDAFPSVGETTEGDPFILFGNLKQGAIFGDKQQLRVKLLDQATITDTDDEEVLNLAEQDMVAIRVVERVGYTIALPKALTVLKKGADES